MTVCFDARGVCPSCGIDGDAPITPADEVRIAGVRKQANLERASIDPPRPLKGWETYMGIRVGMFVVLSMFGACRGLAALHRGGDAVSGVHGSAVAP